MPFYLDDGYDGTLDEGEEYDNEAQVEARIQEWLEGFEAGDMQEAAELVEVYEKVPTDVSISVVIEPVISVTIG